MKSKKNILVWTLVSLLFINYIGKNLMYGLYTIDKALFIELFCENKDHPEEHCDGTCMLTKISEHTHHHDNPSILAIFQISLVFYIPESIPDIISIEEQDRISFFYENHYTFDFNPIAEEPPITT